MANIFSRSHLYLGTACVAAGLIQLPAYAEEPVEEIIVTASPLGRSADEAITGVSVLMGRELANRLEATLGETLKSEPGVSSTAFGAGASRPLIRGQGGDRVRVLDNGIGSIDASSASPDHAVAVEPAQASRIEVLRGAALLRYGSSGSGGVVNVIDGRIPSRMPDNGSVAGALRVGGSTNGEAFQSAGALDFAIGTQLAAHVDASWRAASDYDTSEGTLDNSDAQSDAFSAGLSYIANDDTSFIGASARQYQTTYGVPGDPDEPVFIELDQTRYDLNGVMGLTGAAKTLSVFAGYADYTHTEFEGPGEPGTVFANKGYEARAELLMAERGEYSAAYGGQISQRDFSAVGEEAFTAPSVTDQYGLYTFQQTKVGNLHIEGAARVESTTVETAALSRDFTGTSVSVGGDYHLSDAFRIGGTVYRTERAPTAEALFSEGPHLATGQYERGNDDLDIEVASGIEAALRYRTGPLSLTANIFHTDYDGYIYELATGEIADDLPVYQYTAADANFTGFELQGQFHAGQYHGADIDFDALLESVKAQANGENLPRVPVMSLLAGVDIALERLTARIEIEHSSEANDLGPLETPTQAYTLSNVFFTWEPATDQDVSFRVSFHNLFDVDARQHSSFLKDSAPLKGRDIRVSMLTNF